MSSRETDVLLAALNAQRRHVLGITEGLSDEDMRRPALPTGWTAAGMVRHLALDVERFWFRGIVAGEPIELDRPDDAVWTVGADESVGAVLDLYRREIELANAIIAATDPSAAPAWWPEDHFPPGFVMPRPEADRAPRDHRDGVPRWSSRRGTRADRRTHLADPDRLTGSWLTD